MYVCVFLLAMHVEEKWMFYIFSTGRVKQKLYCPNDFIFQCFEFSTTPDMYVMFSALECLCTQELTWRSIDYKPFFP